jgi:hypothetical protein
MDTEGIVNKTAPGAVRFRKTPPGALIQFAHQRSYQDILGKAVHFSREVNIRIRSPATKHLVNVGMNRFDKRQDGMAVENRLHQAALPPVRGVSFGQQTMGEHATPCPANDSPAFPIVLLPHNQHVMNVIRVVDQEGRRDNLQTRRLAVAAKAIREESQAVPPEVPPMADQRVSGRTRYFAFVRRSLKEAFLCQRETPAKAQVGERDPSPPRVYHAVRRRSALPQGPLAP